MPNSSKKKQDLIAEIQSLEQQLADERMKTHRLAQQVGDLQNFKGRLHRMENRLEHKEEQYRDLFTHANDAIFVIDPGTKQILDVNRKGLDLLGYKTVDEISKLSVFDLDPPETKDKVNAEIEKLFEQGSVIFEHELICRDKSLVNVEISAKLLQHDGRQTILSFVRDITNRKRFAEVLDRAQRLETAGRVAGQIAHDFNNLLGPLSAYPTLIKHELPAEHAAIEMLDEMEFCAEKIAEINQQLLALGRRGHYSMEPLDLNDLLQKMVPSLDLDGQIDIYQELDTNLSLIQGGAAQLTRVLINLFRNSKEAMPQGGSLRISTKNVHLDIPLQRYESLKPGRYVQLDIADTGTGIAPDAIDKIFDPFFSTKQMDRQRGSGLGLSVVHSIVRDHQGYIAVESQRGQGARFTLYFPESDAVATPNGNEEIRQGSESVLVVDDDPVQRRVATHILKRLGYSVASVATGEEALEMLKEESRDILVLDMAMDGMDGTETYRRILEFQPQQKAIILSGYAMSARVQEALRLGAGTFVPKPVTIISLATALRNELDRK